jgi:hypothetical protein
MNDHAAAPEAQATRASVWVSLCAMTVIGGVLSETRGNFQASAVATLAATALVLGFALAWVRADVHVPATSVLVALVCGELALLSFQPLLVHSQSPRGLETLGAALQVAALLGLVALLATLLKKTAWVSSQPVFWVSLSFLFCIRIAVPWISPTPHIDVFTSGTQGARYLLQGLNPYSQTYADLYDGTYGYKPTFFYGPSYLLWITGGWLLGDIRWGNVAAEVLTALAMLRLLQGTKDAASGRWMILAWLAFPASLFMLEQAWVDSIVLAALAWMWLACARHRFVAAGIAAGLALGVKQTACLAVLLALAWSFRAQNRQAGIRFVLATALTSAVVYGPFLLWDAGAIWHSLVTTVLETPARNDALTLGAWLTHAEWSQHGSALALGSGAFCAALIVWLVRRPRDLTALVGASALAYLAVFLCGFQAFCNYYWFVAGLLALSCVPQMAGGVEQGSGPSLAARDD